MESLNVPFDVSELRSILQTIDFSSHYNNIKPASSSDGVAIVLFLLSALGYLTRGLIWDRPDPNNHIWYEQPQLLHGATENKVVATRDISKRLEEDNYQVVIFWGSQSGTSERFAETLGRECLSHYGIDALVADLSDYDADSIAKISSTHLAIFIVSTYGEGDPSDNTAGLWNWIKRAGNENIKLNKLRYLAFGLGNSNYKYYNRVVDVVADVLDAAGATALIPTQKADEAHGGTEEDFESWKDDVLKLFRQMGYTEKSVEYRPTIQVSFDTSAPGLKENAQVAATHQQSVWNSPIVPLPIKQSRELFTAGDRNCLHIELDLSHSGLVYKTGDHIGIWPCNPNDEIECLLQILDLHSKRNDTLTCRDELTKPKLPPTTTLEAAFRHHLEICAPPSRRTVLEISQFAPTEDAKLKLREFAVDRERYAQLTDNTHITLGRLLRLVSPTQPWGSLPLSFVIESLLPLRPRYYSISSSSVISPRRIAITALVVNKTLPGENTSTIHGLTSNYLLSASKLKSNALSPTPSFQFDSGEEVSQGKVFASLRKSKFKLPITASTPLVLIAAGTGFAPFRAFLAERAKLHAIGKPIGDMVLFFGCRSKDSDFIYGEELNKMKEQLGERLQIITAFSCDDDQKMYVQDRVAEHSARVLELLDAGANVYVCGKASMAREVDRRIEDAARYAKKLEEADAKAWVDGLKKRGKWRADVWG